MLSRTRLFNFYRIRLQHNVKHKQKNMTDRQIKILAAAQILQGYQMTETDFDVEIDYYVEKSMRLANALERLSMKEL